MSIKKKGEIELRACGECWHSYFQVNHGLVNKNIGFVTEGLGLVTISAVDLAKEHNGWMLVP